MDKYLVAVRAVNGNPYYGFNRDLGAAKSTLFSSIAYVAKELLIKIAGEVSLTKYQGWVRNTKNPPAVDKLIEKYTEDSHRSYSHNQDTVGSDLSCNCAVYEIYCLV